MLYLSGTLKPMKNNIRFVIYLAIIALIVSCKKSNSNKDEEIFDNSPPWSIIIDTIYAPFPQASSAPGIKSSRLMGRTIGFVRNNIENFIGGGTLWYNNALNTLLPLVHFKRPIDKWQLSGELPTVEMNEFRNWEFFKDGTGFVACEHGPEWNNAPWPYGNIYVAKYTGNDLSWIKVSRYKSFYHDVSSGDINGDGILDVVGSHLGTRNGNNDNPHIYFGNSDGTFRELINVLPTTPAGGGAGDVEINDIDGDGNNEIIHAGGDPNFEDISFLKFNKQTGQFTKGIFLQQAVPQTISGETYSDASLKKYARNNFKGYVPALKRFHDFNKDGKLDMLSERGDFSVWYGNGNGTFRPVRINKGEGQDPVTQLPIFPNYNCSGHDLLDLESDNDPDLIPTALNFGNKNNITEIDLQRLIYINDNGTFKRLSSEKYKIPKSAMGNSTPDYLQPFIRDGKLCFRGYLDMFSYPDFNNIRYLTIKTNIRANYWY